MTARLSAWKFLLVQLLIIGSSVSYGWMRYHQIENGYTPPEPRRDPILVEPRHDDSRVVSDEQLQRTLYKLRPKLRGKNPQMSLVDHALRFWGVQAEFSDPECLSGVEMRDLLLDERQFRRSWGSETEPFLRQTRYGIRTGLKDGPATASHVDHTLACLAEAGTPLDFPVITNEGETTLRSMFNHTFRSFDLNQTEYEWSTLVFALYLPPHDQWRTEQGQWVSFDRLAKRIMRQSNTRGVCYGSHRLHALTVLLCIDEQESILSPQMRNEIIEYLKSVTDTLVAQQSSEGYWEANWDGNVVAQVDAADLQSRRLLVTGHMLEWWAFAPQEVLPPRDVLIRAGQWLVREIDSLTERDVSRYYAFLTHAGRALALWRGRFPHEVQLPQNSEKL